MKIVQREIVAKEKTIKELITKLKDLKVISQENPTSNLAVLLATWESNSSKWAVILATDMLTETLKIKSSKLKIYWGETTQKVYNIVLESICLCSILQLFLHV